MASENSPSQETETISEPKKGTDYEQVQAIVDRMKKKYEEQGMVNKEAEGDLGDLQAAVKGEQVGTVEVQKVEDLKESSSKSVSFFGKLFLALHAITQPMSNMLMKTKLSQQLTHALTSANMSFSATQWTALSIAVAVIGLLFGLVLGLLAVAALKLNPAIIIVVGLLCFILGLAVALLIPSRKARQRANDIDRELPFALRHASTELKAGIGFYRTLQILAAADYGALSQEFSRVIIEIEEGVDTKQALQHLANRTESKSLRMAVNNMVRALKTGGNLSEAMEDIAGEVSFELRTQLQNFSAKMNFFGVIFIFMAIVLPVFVSILGAIRNTPLAAQGLISFDSIPLTPDVLGMFYLVFMPLLMIWLFLYVFSIQPKM